MVTLNPLALASASAHPLPTEDASVFLRLAEALYVERFAFDTSWGDSDEVVWTDECAEADGIVIPFDRDEVGEKEYEGA